jgi:hypothetical protein
VWLRFLLNEAFNLFFVDNLKCYNVWIILFRYLTVGSFGSFWKLLLRKFCKFVSAVASMYNDTNFTFIGFDYHFIFLYEFAGYIF